MYRQCDFTISLCLTLGCRSRPIQYLADSTREAEAESADLSILFRGHTLSRYAVNPNYHDASIVDVEGFDSLVQTVPINNATYERRYLEGASFPLPSPPSVY